MKPADENLVDIVERLVASDASKGRLYEGSAPCARRLLSILRKHTTVNENGAVIVRATLQDDDNGQRFLELLVGSATLALTILQAEVDALMLASVNSDDPPPPEELN